MLRQTQPIVFVKNKIINPPAVWSPYGKKIASDRSLFHATKETIMQFSKTVPENILEAAKIIAQVIRRKALKSLDIPGTTGLVKAATEQ